MNPYDAAKALLHGVPTLPVHPDIDDGVDFTGKFYAADDKSWSLYDVHFWGEGAKNIRWLCAMANAVPGLLRDLGEPCALSDEGFPRLPIAPILEEDPNLGGPTFEGSLRDKDGTFWTLYRKGKDPIAAVTTRWLFDLVNLVPSLLVRLESR